MGAFAPTRYDRIMREQEILVAIRRVMRAVDMRSKQLQRKAGLTVPQWLVLQALNEAGSQQISALARRVSLSHATVTSILNRLSDKGFIHRERNSDDRRAVRVYLTDKGRTAFERAPELLQEAFVSRYRQLEPWEQKLLTSAIERVASMMEADELEASPILEIGEILGEAAAKAPNSASPLSRK